MKTGLFKSGKQYILTIFFVLVLVSCHYTPLQKQEKPPLDKQLVENILIEMYLLEGKVRVYIYHETPEELKIRVSNEINQLFERYNITYKQFTDSYSYYMSDDAETAKKIMSDITNKLIMLQTEQTNKTKQVDTLNK
ncbi:MAG: DUF4296 domain-containing protein [Bacteroidales bacterium]|jgi:hypothetical protein|nr:DUF4296 domain-containing protein [Bacteroidales bacterium]